MADNGLRHGRLTVHRWALERNWVARLGISAGFAAFLAVMALVSFPLPWTPVPFSMMPFALLVTGAAQRKGWGAASVLMYLAAAALGAPVFAGGEAGWRHLVGSTAGYLWGFVGAAWLVGWYVQRRRRLLDPRTARVLVAGLGALGVLGLVTLTTIALRGTTFTSAWSATQSFLWLFVALAALTAVGTVAWLRRRHGSGHERLNLFLVMMAAIAVIHVPGVVVLKAMTGLVWSEAIALGSTVFLPFDLLKAGAATGLTTLFLPTHDETLETPDV